MKLFGWMHRKIRQHSIEPFKDFTIGNCCTCLSHQPSHDGFNPEPSYYSKSLKLNNRECQLSIPKHNTKKIEEQQVISETLPDFFHGFLTIGTLGSQPTLSEPATPTFGVPSGNIAEMDIEVTENELKVINDELDKFLEAEAKEGCDESGRNSYVSVVTLDGKHMEETDGEECEKLDTCPLQGYLLGSSIELPDSRIDAKKEKAPSLRELFQMTKLSDEYLKQEKELHKSNVPLMKKMLQKLQISYGKTTRKEASHSVPTKNKIKKVLHMFHKRIHPETLKGEREKNSPKHEINSSQSCYEEKDFSVYDENKRFPQRSVSKDGSRCNSYISGLCHNVDSSGNFYGNREQWIKTDSDYLVLEL